MKLILRLILASFLLIQTVFAQTFDWATKEGGSGSDHADHIATDPSGNSYVYGTFEGSVTFGTTTLNDAAGNYFLAKYNNSGTIQWVIQIKNAIVRSMKTNGTYLYMAGYNSTGGMIGSTALPAATNYNAFVIRLDPSGNTSLLITGTSPDSAGANGLDIDQNGNMYIVGFYVNSVLFGTTTIAGSPSNNYYVIKFSPAGTILWKSTGSQTSHHVYGRCISVNAAGTLIYALGSAEGSGGATGIDSVSFSNSSIHYESLADGCDFGAKYNSAGTLMLVKETAFGATHRTTEAIAQDLSGNFFTTETHSYSNYVIKKYTPQLNVIWSVTDPLNTEASINELLVDTHGGIYAASAYTTGSAIFSGDTMNGGSMYNSYVIHYDSSGNLKWVHGVFDTDADPADGNSASGLSWDSQENIYITGSFGGSINFDAVNQTASGFGDIYIAKLLLPCSIPASPVSSGNQTVCTGALPAVLHVTSSPGTTVDWYSAASGGTLLTSGNLNYTAASAGTYYAESRANTTGCSLTSSSRTPVTLAVTSNITYSQNIALCFGTSINIGAHTYTAPGTFMDTLTASGGCDSTVTTTITVGSPIDVSVSLNGDTLSANLSGAGYQWLDCLNNNLPVAGATQQVFIPVLSGTYSVLVFSNSCFDTSVCNMVVPVNSTGIYNPDEANDFIVYPNPNSGVMTIRTATKEIYTLINALGEVVSTYELPEGSNVISLSEIKNGVYYITGNHTSGIKHKLVLAR